MLTGQSKNNIKAVIAVLLAVVIGDGIFGAGVYWPFLLILLDSKWIYWMALGVGVLISSIYHIPVGLPSLFMVVITGGLSLIFSSRKETGWVMLAISIICNLVFDKVFELNWTVWESLLIIFFWLFSVRWFEKTESIKLNY